MKPDVLLLAQDGCDAEPVRDLLRSEAGELHVTADAQVAAGLFLRHAPDLVVLCLQSAAAVEQACAALLLHASPGSAAHHRTLVLCRLQDAAHIHRLCREGVVDDYVVNRPLYDPNRIRLSVWQLHQQVRACAVARGGRRGGADIAEDRSRTATILIVDDAESFRVMLRDMLNGMGIRVQEAECGGSALELMRRDPPQLVLLDFDMPDIDGMQVIEAMHASPRLCDIPVIMLTGLGTRDVVAQARQHGVVDFMVKPIRKDQLREKLARHITLPATAGY